MVTKKDTLQLLTILGQTYNYFKFPKDDPKDTEFMVVTWHGVLEHLDRAIVFEALKEHIRHETEVPTPAHIMQKVKQMTTNQLPANQAYAQLMSSISRYGYYRQQECMECLPKAIQDTVKLMGGLSIFVNADEGDTYLKNSFVKNYEQAVEVEERERLLPEGVREQRKKLLDRIRGQAMSKCFNSVEELKEFLGHGDEETLEEIFQSYQLGVIDEMTIYQIKENLQDG